jgi:acyl carrier protein
MDRIDQLLSEVFADDFDGIDEATAFKECAAFDSLKYVELVVAVESRFGVDLTADEIGRLTSKGALRQLLAARGLVAG